MNECDALTWVDGFQSFGMQLGLERINLLMDYLGNPQNEYKTIHVGGTNGKGSVCQYISTILSESGYRCGLYTSPHLQHILERFIVNGSPITPEVFACICTQVKEKVDFLINQGIQPTYFEVCTAIAFLFFKIKKVEYAVIEVGLGGRYDATNIIDPELSIITNVSLEHQQVLGQTIEDIASEKAGIIKDYIPVITAATNQAFEIIKNTAYNKKASMYHIDSSNIDVITHTLSGQDLLISGLFQQYHIHTSMLGLYQQENIALAIAAIEHLQMKGAFIPEEALLNGIAQTVIPGRLEQLKHHPLVLVDGAHTVDAMISIKETMQSLSPDSSIIVVFGILEDKKISDILSIVNSFADIIIVTKSSCDRALDPSEIMQYIENNTKKRYIQTSTLKEGMKEAFSHAGKESIILITGSLTMVGDAKTYFCSK